MGLRAREVQLNDPTLLTPAAVRELADNIGLRPTKGRGQNFVVDPNTVRRIVRIAGPDPSDTIIEIGPGLGSLTLGLLASGARVIAIELDTALAGQLPATVARFAPEQAGRCHCVQADAMRITDADLAGDAALPEPTMLVANLPYNVSVPVLLHMFETFSSVVSGLVMVQAEVAHRLVAGPGSRIYGVPSLKSAWYADLELVGSVPRTVFWPVPNVDSALVSWRRRRPRDTPALRTDVFALIDAAFSQRRKSLRAAMARFFGSGAAAETALARAGIDHRHRGEQLAIDDFIALAELSPPGLPLG